MALASVLVFVYVLEVGERAGGDLAHDPWPRIRRSWGRGGSSTPLAALSFFFVFGIGSLGQPHVRPQVLHAARTRGS